MLKKQYLVSSIAISSFLCMPVFAQENISLNQSTEYGSNSINTKTDIFFAERLKELSNNQISIIVHSGGSLGYREKDHLFAVADGAVPIATTVSGTLSGVDPLFLLSSLPFVAADFDDVRLLEEIARPYYEEIFEQYGQVLIHSGWVDASGVWANFEVTEISDLDGVRIRTYDSNGTRVLQSIGASPLQISWSDVVPQLATGSIDAVLTGVDGGASQNFWDYTDAFTQINYAMPLTFVHMNAEEFYSLPESLQDAIMQAGKEAAQWRSDTLSENQVAKYNELRDNGMVVVESIDADLAADFTSAAEPLISDWIDRTDGRGAEILEEFNQRRGQQ